MIRNRLSGLLGLVVLGSLACSEIGPTAVDSDLLPDEPVTVEVLVPWAEFGSNLEAFGGFGTTDALGIGVAAHAMGDSLEAYTLVSLSQVPRSATVRDTTGTSRTDTLLHVLRGRIMAVIDTVGSVANGPVTLEVGMLGQAWDAPTATWTHAIDSLLGGDVAWDAPGAGPVSNVLTTTWDPAAGDTAVFELDSALVAAWSDTTAQNQGMRLGVLSPGTRLEIDNVLLQVDVTPSSNPDTTVVVAASRRAMTFIYTPQPDPADGIRVGGTPSWRTVMDIAVPGTLSGPPALCAVVGCPVTLTATRVNYAALVLYSRSVDEAFRPSDTVNIDVRPVFDRSTLPKAPLGASLLVTSIGKRFGPGLFGVQEGTEVEIPITSFVRSLLQPDSAAPLPPPRTLALLSTFEPISIAYANFFGPDSPLAPMLKIVVTVGRAVELP